MLTMLRKENKEKGFTLVELMIVVAIIGILAAIAIPNFRNYQMKSKTAEAKTNLGGIKTSQESYRAENDSYLRVIGYPATVPGSDKTAWAEAANFKAIGFAPSGGVYYSYGVNALAAGGGTTPMYVAYAQGDLDGDGTGGAAAYASAVFTGADCNAEEVIIDAGVAANDGLFTQNSDGELEDKNAGIW